jgi:hypothetical protein
LDVVHLGQQGGQVGLVPEQAAGRRCNRGGGQSSGGHLVEQGLKQVVVGLVNQGDVNRCFGQRFGRFETTETPADDDHMGSFIRHVEDAVCGGPIVV